MSKTPANGVDFGWSLFDLNRILPSRSFQANGAMSHSELFVLLNSVTDPIYVQLVDQVRRYVASGRLTAGQPLPSVRELGQKLGVNPMTVSKAYRLLKAEGTRLTSRAPRAPARSDQHTGRRYQIAIAPRL